MAAPKGNRNNPNGRPPKNKALSTMLEAALDSKSEYNGKKTTGKAILADLVVRAATTGRLRFPSDTEDSIISIQDWLGLAKWVFERIDGRPVQAVEGVGDDGEIVIKVRYDE